MIGLTHKQAEVLAFIERYHEEHAGVSPSYQEIVDGTGYASKSRIWHMMKALKDKGRVRQLPGRARAIEVVRDNPLSSFTLEQLTAEIERRQAA